MFNYNHKFFRNMKEQSSSDSGDCSEEELEVKEKSYFKVIKVLEFLMFGPWLTWYIGIRSVDPGK